MELKWINEDYWIDSNGYIYSRVRFGTPGGVVRQWIDGGGYYNVRLHIKNKVKNLKVHRLYAQAFLSNPKNLPQVNHIDGNKLNNHLSNLEWCTASENMKHAVKTGLKKYERSSSGQKYIYYEKHNKCYRVIVHEYEKKHRFGRFKDLNDAIKVRDAFLFDLLCGK